MAKIQAPPQPAFIELSSAQTAKLNPFHAYARDMAETGRLGAILAQVGQGEGLSPDFIEVHWIDHECAAAIQAIVRVAKREAEQLRKDGNETVHP